MGHPKLMRNPMLRCGTFGLLCSLHWSYRRYGFPMVLAHGRRVYRRVWWRLYRDAGSMP